MIIKKHFIKVSMVSFLLLNLIFSTKLFAQDEEGKNLKFRGFGLNMGIYEPEFDYFKNDTNSEFYNESFSTAISVKGFVEFLFIKNFTGRLGVGYWQKRAETRLQYFGKTTMLVTGNPITLDLVYYIAPARIGFVTPYIGVGAELLFIQYGLDFEDKENPDPVNGTSALTSGMLGLEFKLSKNFTLDVFGQYKAGSYEQNFIREIENPDPDMPNSVAEVTEEISLTGPEFGITFKYLFK